MRRHFLVVVAAYAMSPVFGLCISDCPADTPSGKMLPAEFVQPPEIFVRHTATKEYCSPTVVPLPSGKLYIPRWNFESADGGRTWKPVKKDRWPESNNVIRLRDGRWAAIVFEPTGLGQGSSMPAICLSSDNGATWTEPVKVTDKNDIYYVMNERLIETSRKTLVVSVARGGGKYEGDNNAAGCFYSTDGGKIWSTSETWARLDGDRGMAEPVVAELADGRLLMLARTGKGSHHRSYSADSGRTWSAPEPTTLTAACSPLTMKTMPDGGLLVLYDHAEPIRPEAFFPRRPLVYAVSRDGGETWSAPRLIDNEAGQQHIYPSVTFLDHGILVVYSSQYASPKGDFSQTKDWWKIGGGKSCVLKYPARSRD